MGMQSTTFCFLPSPGTLSVSRRCDVSSFTRGSRVQMLPKSDTSFLSSSSEMMPSADSVSDSAATFEPILNVPALGTFVVIGVIFSFLFIRTRATENAIERRKVAMSKLREIKALETTGEAKSDEVDQCLKEFESAMEQEESLRTLIPGMVRIAVVPTNSSKASEKEARLAAQRFLGRDFQIERDEKPQEGGEMSKVSIAVLVVVFLGQISLLFYLNQATLEASSSMSFGM